MNERAQLQGIIPTWEGFATGVGLGLTVYRIARPHR